MHLLRQSEGIFQNISRGKVKQMQLCMGFEDTFENAQQSKSQTNAIIATTHLPMHTFLGVIRKNVMGKVSKKLNTNVFPTHVW